MGVTKLIPELFDGICPVCDKQSDRFVIVKDSWCDEYPQICVDCLREALYDLEEMGPVDNPGK